MSRNPKFSPLNIIAQAQPETFKQGGAKSLALFGRTCIDFVDSRKSSDAFGVRYSKDNESVAIWNRRIRGHDRSFGLFRVGKGSFCLQDADLTAGELVLHAFGNDEVASGLFRAALPLDIESPAFVSTTAIVAALATNRMAHIRTDDDRSVQPFIDSAKTMIFSQRLRPTVTPAVPAA